MGETGVMAEMAMIISPHRFSRRDLLALALDPPNQKIRGYLQEVDQRLKTLEEIKSQDEG